MNEPANITRQEPLSKHSTLMLGGPADYFAEPSSEAELAELVSYASQEDIPLTVIGQGTNVLFRDTGFKGLVIKIGAKMSSIKVSGSLIDVQAGAWVPGIARCAQTRGLAGLEHIVGIPGTLGGLVVMNGGSRREAIASAIQQVRVMRPNGSIETLERQQCEFGYRRSAFQSGDFIVVSATLQCTKSSSRSVRTEMLQILRSRRRKFPRKLPNCGSVFKSDPITYELVGPPGKVIESLGLKGMRIGGAVVSDQHANFFLNLGNAKSADYMALISETRKRALETYGVSLELEVVVV